MKGLFTAMNKENKVSKNKIVLVGIVCVFVVMSAVIGVLVAVNTQPDTITINEKEYNIVVESEAQAEEFVQQFYDTKNLYSASQEFVPIEFNDTYNKYNELQKKQGFNLEQYKGERCTIYVYKLADYKIDGDTTYFTVMVYDDRVIGGHISTLIKDSPMYTFYGEKI